MNKTNTNPKLAGAILTFIILQLLYLFFFFIRFPSSFRTAVGAHSSGLVAAASWVATVTMFAYCIICLVSVAQLVMRKHAFLRWFQISGAVALVGNFIAFVLRQINSAVYGSYRYSDGDWNWALFILALFWTVIWCMYFARSSRLYTFMGNDSTYLRMAFFTKNVNEPTPWEPEKPAFGPAGQPFPPRAPMQQPAYPPAGAAPQPGVYPPPSTAGQPVPPPAPGYQPPAQPPVTPGEANR